MKVECLKWFAGALLCSFAALAAAAAKEEPVTLDTPTGKLSGSLLLPASTGKLPVALIIAGSGPTDRDGNSALTNLHTDSYKMLAQVLADAGVASLRYDKRGVAASIGAVKREEDASFDTMADDANAWAALLRADPRFGPLLIIGHSEGSLLGMLAAQRNNAAVFISISGAADRASDILRKQLAGRLPPDLATENERILSALEHGETVPKVPPALMTLYRPSVQPYLISWFHYTPRESIKALQMHVLIIQGDNDLQVGVDQALALKAAKPDATAAIIPGMNHVLKTVPVDRQQNLAAYHDPALPLSPQLVSAITGMLRTWHVTGQ